jgi:alpha-1,6-mannosyltransferase
LRWSGLAGTALLAAGGFLAGALPGAAPRSQAEALWGTGPGFRVGLAAYLAGLVLLGWAWWRLGQRMRGGERPSLRWVLVTGMLWAGPLLVAPPLGSRDLYAYACQGAVWLDGHDPYAVGAAAGGCPWLAAVPPVWHDSTAPYGPLALVASAAAVALARAVADGTAGLVVAVGALRLAAVTGALLVAAFGPRLARACGVDPAAAAWLGLITPLVAVHVVAGGHNDALVAGLVVAGLALAPAYPPPIREKLTRVDLRSRQFLLDQRGVGPRVAARVGPQVAARVAARVTLGAEVAAGVALGLAVAVKVTAVVALPFAMLLALGGDRGWRRAVAMGLAAVAAFAALSLSTGLGIGWLSGLADTGALAQWSSPPTGLGMAVGYGLWGLGWPEAYDPAVAVARVVGLAVLAVVAAALLVRAWQRIDQPRVVVACAGTTLAAVVVLGPVLYPWYALAPLAVLAAATVDPRVVRGLAGATLGLTVLVLPSGLGVPVLTKLPGALLMAAATLAVSWWWLRRRRRRGTSRRPSPGSGHPGPPPERPAPAP